MRKITPQAVFTTLVGACGSTGDVPAKTDFTSKNTTGAAARFGAINGMLYDGDNALYVVTARSQLIRKIILNDGTRANAKFKGSDGIAQDAQGNLFVSSYGQVIRKLELVKKP